jgi:nitrate/TMAO reductase-like tetraheme cytochrome c subunit
MLKKLRTALSTAEGKLKAVILVSGIAILLLIFTAGALALTSTPTFCKTCHEMNPEYYTWQGSAHNQISCVKCHIEPGAANFVKHKVESFSQLYYHFTGSYVTPIEIKEPIKNSVCMQCHDMEKRVTTPSGDIKFPHTKHLAEKVNCVQCHAGVVHGSIEEKGFTAMTDFKAWNSRVGQSYVNSQVSKYYTKIQMKDCIDCHTDRNAPLTCDTCHTKIIKPESHLATNWLSTHGKEANTDMKACDRCHSVTSKYKGDIPKEVTIVEYARTNTFCNKCHTKQPTGHDAMWRKGHTIPAKENRTLCIVCHNEAGANAAKSAPNKGNYVPAITACQDCHFKRHERFFTEATHPFKVPPSGYGVACKRCHLAKKCEACHAKAGT